MTKDNDNDTEELSAYESMLKERLELLKESLEDTYEKGDTEDDKSSKLVSCIMMHLASVYTRLDIALGEIERLSEAVRDSLDAKEDFEKDLAKEST